MRIKTVYWNEMKREENQLCWYQDTLRIFLYLDKKRRKEKTTFSAHNDNDDGDDNEDEWLH